MLVGLTGNMSIVCYTRLLPMFATFPAEAPYQCFPSNSPELEVDRWRWLRHSGTTWFWSMEGSLASTIQYQKYRLVCSDNPRTVENPSLPGANNMNSSYSTDIGLSSAKRNQIFLRVRSKDSLMTSVFFYRSSDYFPAISTWRNNTGGGCAKSGYSIEYQTQIKNILEGDFNTLYLHHLIKHFRALRTGFGKDD